MALASGGACGVLKSFSHPRAAEKAVRIGKICSTFGCFPMHLTQEAQIGTPYPRHVIVRPMRPCGDLRTCMYEPPHLRAVALESVRRVYTGIWVCKTCRSRHGVLGDGKRGKVGTGVIDKKSLLGSHTRALKNRHAVDVS